MNYGHHMNEFADCADWNLASFTADPVDLLEPETFEPNAFREAAIRMIVVLEAADTFVSGARDARLAWIQVSIALGLHSTLGKSETEIAAEMGITKQAISRGTVTFLRITGLSPAFGLKTTAARRTYQKTNGGRFAESKDSETPAVPETDA